MDKRIKDMWVKALRSGNYKQSHYALRTQSGYCCLGVLCDLATEETELGEWTLRGDRYAFRYRDVDGESLADDVLPKPIWEWAGLTMRNPIVLDQPHGNTLAYLNDHHYNFNDIADVIEAEL